MKKTLTLLILLITSLAAANAEEITIWEGSTSGNLILSSSSNSANYSTLVANLASGDKIKFYYTEASAGAEVYLQSNWSDIRNSAVLDIEADSYEFTVTPTMVSTIASTGFILRPNNTCTLTKICVIKVSEITIWENAEGLNDNLRFAAGSNELNSFLAFLSVGNVVTVYYTGAYTAVNEELTQKYCYHKLWFQTYDMNTTYSNAILGGHYQDLLYYDEGSKDIFVTQDFIDQITENGLTLRRGGWASFKFTKLTVSKPSAKIPGYEMLYDGDPHPVAWGKLTVPAPKKALLNLQVGDKIHAKWDINSTWANRTNGSGDPDPWYPAVFRLANVYNGSSTISGCNTSINKDNVDKTVVFTLNSDAISTILSNELVFSGYYYDLTKAYLEHPDRFVSVTTNSDGLATFGHTTEAIDCSWFESLGLKAYTASISGDRIVTTKVTEAVPAGTGLILQGEPSTTYKLPFAAGADAVVGNVLQPTTGENVSGYVLAKHSKLGIGFYKVTNQAVAAGKAYIADISSARYFSIDFLDVEPTSIQNAPLTERTVTQAAYNLMGQRVSANSKGLVIINGKKVYNK